MQVLESCSTLSDFRSRCFEPRDSRSPSFGNCGGLWNCKAESDLPGELDRQEPDSRWVKRASEFARRHRHPCCAPIRTWKMSERAVNRTAPWGSSQSKEERREEMGRTVSATITNPTVRTERSVLSVINRSYPIRSDRASSGSWPSAYATYSTVRSRSAA